MKLGQKVIFVTDTELCFKIAQCGSEVVPDSLCTQEEAGGYLLFHTAHAVAQDHQTVVTSLMILMNSSCF